MKINKLKINSYGKLKNKEIELQDNINIIYGKNESGKSTILKFIINSFYGASKNKNGKEISDYEKYKPWNSDDFSGKIEYELDNKEKYEVYREFGKKNPKIFDEGLKDISKDFNIDKNKGNEFFYEQTKISEELFLSTSTIIQQEVKIEKKMQNILIQKISNLVVTGEDNISYKKTIEKLNKKQLEEIGTDRSKGKPINLVKQEIKKLEEEKEKLQKYKEEKIKIENKKEEIINEIKKEEIKNKLIKEIKTIKEKENLEKEKIKIKEKINYENLEKINKLNLEKNNILKNNKINYEKENNLEINKEKKKIKISIILFLIINILIYFITQKNIFYIIFSLTATMEIILFVLFKNKINKKIKLEESKIKDKINKLENEINLLEKNKNNLNEEINKIKNAINFENNLQKEKIKNNYFNKINLNEINYLLNSQNINYELELIQNKIYNYKIQENKFELEKENIENELDKLATIEEKIVNLYDNYENLIKRNKSIDMAKEFLAVAYEKMKNNISPNFIKNLSDNIKNITNGKYKKLKFSDETGLVVELENGNYVNTERLSIGTIEQLYLSLRIAILEEISKENIPIILDEAFAYYDDERLKNILEYINKKFNKKQIIIFTCTNREKEILEKLNIKFNFVEI